MWIGFDVDWFRCGLVSMWIGFDGFCGLAAAVLAMVRLTQVLYTVPHLSEGNKLMMTLWLHHRYHFALLPPLVPDGTSWVPPIEHAQVKLSCLIKTHSCAVRRYRNRNPNHKTSSLMLLVFRNRGRS